MSTKMVLPGNGTDRRQKEDSDEPEGEETLEQKPEAQRQNATSALIYRRYQETEPDPRATAGQRLSALRKAAGFETASDFARSAHEHVAMYQRHESDRARITQAKAEELAALLHSTAAYILYGNEAIVPKVPVIGLIGFDGRVLRRGEGKLDLVDAPRDANPTTAALRVANGDLFPSFARNDLLFFDESWLSAKLDPGVVDGRECVVETKHDGIWLAWVTISVRTNRATLMRHSGRTAVDVPLTAAAPVLKIVRAQNSENGPAARMSPALAEAADRH